MTTCQLSEKTVPNQLPTDGLPKSRAQAIREGVQFYVTDKLCPKEHVSPRYTRGSRCVLCALEANASKFGSCMTVVLERGRLSVSRAVAVRGGISKYVSEAPCPSGHYERYTASNNCVECNKAQLKRDKENKRWARFRSIYGIGKSEYDAMLLLQDNRCAICEEVLNDKGTHIDHCHNSGAVRGLLCSKCNQGIGLLREDVGIMQKAINYVSNTTPILPARGA